MDRNTLKDNMFKSLKYFLTTLRTFYWTESPNEKTVDSSFKAALELEETFLQENKNSVVEELISCYPNVNLKKPVEVLLQCILQNHNFDENLMYYAIKKYILLYSKSEFLKVLKRTLSEIDLRQELFNLIEEFPDVDLDFVSINKSLCDLLNSEDLQSQVSVYLQTRTSLFLKAINHSMILNAQIMVEEMINCLDIQPNLKLWFMIMKNENLDTVLDICAEHENFLLAVFKFFDKFAHETETNYDEELNVIYSHVNLDFEDFLKILQLFLRKRSIAKAVKNYLESKTLLEKNFCFWTDVKACLE